MALTAQDRKWQRESDANTLAEAATINSDKARLKGATSEASRMAKESQVRANKLKSISKKKK